MKREKKAHEAKVQKRLTAERVAGSQRFDSFGGGQANLNREDSDKETEMNIEYRKDKQLQPMGKNDELSASYDQLVALFGEPNAGPSPDGKITVQWDLKVDGIKVSVWDYKTGGKVNENTMWSVWAEDIDAVDALQEFFEDQGEEAGNHMLETVREEISHMNTDTDGMFFYAVAEVLGRYIVRTLKTDGSLTEQTLKEFYEEISG